jgi:hypothetical protein
LLATPFGFAGFRAVIAAAVLSGATLFFGEAVALGAFAAGLGVFAVFGAVFAALSASFLVAFFAAVLGFFDAEVRTVLAVFFFFNTVLDARVLPAAAARFAFFFLLVFFFVRVAIAGFLWLVRTTASRRQRRRFKFDQSKGRR